MNIKKLTLQLWENTDSTRVLRASVLAAEDGSFAVLGSLDDLGDQDTYVTTIDQIEFSTLCEYVPLGWFELTSAGVKTYENKQIQNPRREVVVGVEGEDGRIHAIKFPTNSWDELPENILAFAKLVFGFADHLKSTRRSGVE
jgi:hypothetical protein